MLVGRLGRLVLPVGEWVACAGWSVGPSGRWVERPDDGWNGAERWWNRSPGRCFSAIDTEKSGSGLVKVTFPRELLPCGHRKVKIPDAEIGFR